jgi:hypothetical protein
MLSPLDDCECPSFDIFDLLFMARCGIFRCFVSFYESLSYSSINFLFAMVLNNFLFPSSFIPYFYRCYDFWVYNLWLLLARCFFLFLFNKATTISTVTPVPTMIHPILCSWQNSLVFWNVSLTFEMVNIFLIFDMSD